MINDRGHSYVSCVTIERQTIARLPSCSLEVWTAYVLRHSQINISPMIRPSISWMLRSRIHGSIKAKRVQSTMTFPIARPVDAVYKNLGKLSQNIHIPIIDFKDPTLIGYWNNDISRAISPKRTWNFVEINVPYEEATQCRQQIIDRMAPLDTVMDLVRIIVG